MIPPVRAREKAAQVCSRMQSGSWTRFVVRSNAPALISKFDRECVVDASNLEGQVPAGHPNREFDKELSPCRAAWSGD